MKCGCESSWNQLDFERNEKPYCPTHDTYGTKGECKDTYNDEPILSDEEYEIINQAYIENSQTNSNIKINDINELAQEIHQNAVDHGWWEDERSFGDIIALCHSELSEALEEYRDKKEKIYYSCASDKNIYSGSQCGEECDLCTGGKPEGIAIELADCIIRIFDYCGKENIDIKNAIMIKHEYNKTRPYRHGGKKL